ncbi:alpha-amylase [Mycoplasma sp. NEAQ87857]|uniref:alpha-amylase family glycosyl hydrolase n=1 Tax=Mycoplasma sp. NEAQ87857 TaxID=2683967 RepID=UPI001318CC30|nr:alpha-amylase family glycosyl hydrolase [Mycoplasma sp. NEAQ87857]QGZ97233.1 alpha-amylase [Mycoplasma sp. NEAQ87857]
MIKNKFKKLISTILTISTSVAVLPIVACVNKKPLNYEGVFGDQSFVASVRQRNINHLDYIPDAEHVKAIAPFNLKAKKSNVMYQLLVYTFADGNNDGIGDFIGLKNNLDYFTNLGIDILYLSPIFPASSYHGYDVIDYLDVAPELGGMQAFDDFLIAAHKAGIRVVLDVPFNHTSYEHPWFQKALKSEGYRDYYFFGPLPSKVTSNFGAPVSTPIRTGVDKGIRSGYYNIDNRKYVPDTNQTYAAWFWSGMPDLNLENESLLKQIDAVHKFWVTKGVDGFRYDAFEHFFPSSYSDTSPYHSIDEFGWRTVKLFKRWRKVANLALKKRQESGITNASNDTIMFGEWWSSPIDDRSKSFYFDDFLEKPEKALGSLIDGQHWKLNWNVSINDGEETYLKNILNNNESKWMPFLDNHDVPRWISNFKQYFSKEIITEKPFKLNADQVGAYEYAIASLLSRGGYPTLYQGNELLMQGGDKDKGDKYVREAFYWKDNNKKVKFHDRRNSNDLIDTYTSKGMGYVEDMIKDPDSAYNMTRKIIALRQEFPSVRSQETKYIANPNEVVDFGKNAKDDIRYDETTLRRNEDGSFILIVYSWGNREKANLHIKPGYKIEKEFLAINLKTSETNAQGTIILGTSDPKNRNCRIGAYKIVKS